MRSPGTRPVSAADINADAQRESPVNNVEKCPQVCHEKCQLKQTASSLLASQPHQRTLSSLPASRHPSEEYPLDRVQQISRDLIQLYRVQLDIWELGKLGVVNEADVLQYDQGDFHPRVVEHARHT